MCVCVCVLRSKCECVCSMSTTAMLLMADPMIRLKPQKCAACLPAECVGMCVCDVCYAVCVCVCVCVCVYVRGGREIVCYLIECLCVWLFPCYCFTLVC